MTKIIKLCIALVVIGGLSYLAYFVPLGKKTFFEHMIGISETDEAKDLEKELGNKVKETATEVKEQVKDSASSLSKAAGKIVSNIGEEKGDETAQKETVHSKEAKQSLADLVDVKNEPSEEDRQALNQLVKQKNAKSE